MRRYDQIRRRSRHSEMSPAPPMCVSQLVVALNPLNGRQTPSCPKVGFLPPGAGVRIVCQRVGQGVWGAYGFSEIWDYVVAEASRGLPRMEGLVADANIYTGSNGLVAEVCR